MINPQQPLAFSDAAACRPSTPPRWARADNAVHFGRPLPPANVQCGADSSPTQGGLIGKLQPLSTHTLAVPVDPSSLLNGPSAVFTPPHLPYGVPDADPQPPLAAVAACATPASACTCGHRRICLATIDCNIARYRQRSLRCTWCFGPAEVIARARHATDRVQTA